MSVQLYLFLKRVAVVNPEACIGSAEQATLILIEPKVQHFKGLLPHCDNVFGQPAPGWSDAASQKGRLAKGSAASREATTCRISRRSSVLCGQLDASCCRMLSKVNARNRKADLRKTARDHQTDKSFQRQRCDSFRLSLRRHCVVLRAFNRSVSERVLLKAAANLSQKRAFGTLFS